MKKSWGCWPIDGNWQLHHQLTAARPVHQHGHRGALGAVAEAGSPPVADRAALSWVGWVQKGDQITPFALNIAMAGAADAPRREQLARASLQALGFLPSIPALPAPAP
jgi:beta-lactamase class D